MKIIAINGSARKDGNTAYFIEKSLEPLYAAGFECELIQLAGQKIRGCTACGGCRKEGANGCVQDDFLSECIRKVHDAHGLIIGSPTYFSDVTAETKALIDRTGYSSRAQGNALRRKVGAGIAVARRAGEIHAFLSINQLFLISEMIVPGSSYWNVGIAKEIGDAVKDTEGIETMRRLGENMAWLLNKLYAAE